MEMMSSRDQPSGQLELLHERLELAAMTSARGRGVALLSIRVHERGMPLEPSAELCEAHADGVRERIERSLRRVDTLATIGPLHYVALLERVEKGPFAVHVADEILASMRNLKGRSGEEVGLVASVGISVYPDDAENVDDLVRYADAASHAAQLGGGNLFGFHSGAMNEEANRRIIIERALVDVLERDELTLSYQPKIDTRDGSIAGVEALLRWHNRKLGAVSPAEFIPVLEATGRIEEIGVWVLHRACAQAAEWNEAGHGIPVAVNVSAHQLRGGEFESEVDRALEESRLPHHLLELELTEGVLVDNLQATRDTLCRLRQRGVRVAVDDFGTGYASLSYVRHFPMDVLKIDRQFVRGLPVDEENAAITSAIVALAQSLRIETVAEGVETEAEEEFLHSLDCFVVQGFRHAKPMTVPQLAAWRKARPWA
jgi:EAL domain-containing protein (putative c-di-GMP-specific phosphodiesterase class I)